MINADLKLEPCSHATAKDAVLRWHYSRSMPLVSHRFGVWEGGQFVGAVLFGFGLNRNIASPFGLERGAVLELVRVALGPHDTPTSRVVAVTVRLLRRRSPGTKLLVSYADTNRGHHGGIYQALGWTYLGPTSRPVIRLHGAPVHTRSVSKRYGQTKISWLRANVDPTAERVKTPPKHKYALALDEGLEALLLSLSRPYPKRVASIAGDASAFRAG